jgi:hypothetical protein
LYSNLRFEQQHHVSKTMMLIYIITIQYLATMSLGMCRDLHHCL